MNTKDFAFFVPYDFRLAISDTILCTVFFIIPYRLTVYTNTVNKQRIMKRAVRDYANDLDCLHLNSIHSSMEQVSHNYL